MLFTTFSIETKKLGETPRVSVASMVHQSTNRRKGFTKV